MVNQNNKKSISFLCMYIASIAFTILLFLFPNQSNFKSSYVIPLIVVLLVKYLFGDFDVGYQWTMSDILFWFSIPLVSHLTVLLISL